MWPELPWLCKMLLVNLGDEPASLMGSPAAFASAGASGVPLDAVDRAFLLRRALRAPSEPKDANHLQLACRDFGPHDAQHLHFTLLGAERRVSERHAIDFTLRGSALETSTAAGIQVAIAVLTEKRKTLATVRGAVFSKQYSGSVGGGKADGPANLEARCYGR